MFKKNYFKMILLFGIIITSILNGCDLFDNETVLEGTWIGDTWIYEFNGSNFIIKYKNGTNRQKGTFSLNFTNTRYTGNATHDWENSSWVSKTFTGGSCDIVITGNTFTFSNATWFTGSYTYTKQ